MQAVTEKLNARLQELLARESVLTSDLRHEDGALASDSEEQATELENSEVLEALDEQTRKEIDQIRAALHRLAVGKYESCSVCGEPIASKRLLALPYTTTCVSCAS